MIGIHLRIDQGQLRKLSDKLASWERKRVLHQTVEEVAGLLKDVLGEYPEQRSVSRRSAFGVTFFSDRQRRWFFAALRSGELSLPYSRTGALRDGWKLEPLGKNEVGLINEVPYAGYVMGKASQSRMMRMIGWKTVESVLKKYRPRVGRVALQNIRTWLNS